MASGLFLEESSSRVGILVSISRALALVKKEAEGEGVDT